MKTLPPVALGTWSWGTGFAGGDTVFGNHLSDTQMAEMFTTAMSKGLNLWDTAAVYGMGSSEAALGALARQCVREDNPYQTLDGVKTFIDSLPVNKAEKEAIAFRNAERLLGITV